ncbi:MAG: DUF2007 domain-containing protein [Bacteroidales bacterium]|jgi:hypothetical protein|nr:DUF2007 domain-containing protein [Bacteroidales bacterium]
MTDKNDLTLLFTGSEINANVLKEILEDNQISSLVRNDMNSSKAAGFGVSFGSEANLYVANKDIENAKVLLDQFLKSFENK